MDLRLPLLADANLHIGIAEEALAEQSFLTARREWEKAALALEELQKTWPEEAKEAGLLRAMYLPLESRFKEVGRRLPKEHVLQEMPEEEREKAQEDEQEEEH